MALSFTFVKARDASSPGEGSRPSREGLRADLCSNGGFDQPDLVVEERIAL
jgi:hypothetical protein